MKYICSTYRFPLKASKYFLLTGKLFVVTVPVLPARNGCCLWNNGMLISNSGRICCQLMLAFARIASPVLKPRLFSEYPGQVPEYKLNNI